MRKQSLRCAAYSYTGNTCLRGYQCCVVSCRVVRTPNCRTWRQAAMDGSSGISCKYLLQRIFSFPAEMAAAPIHHPPVVQHFMFAPVEYSYARSLHQFPLSTGMSPQSSLDSYVQGYYEKDAKALRQASGHQRRTSILKSNQDPPLRG